MKGPSFETLASQVFLALGRALEALWLRWETGWGGSWTLSQDGVQRGEGGVLLPPRPVLPGGKEDSVAAHSPGSEALEIGVCL